MSAKIWLRLGALAAMVAAQIFALHSNWIFDTQRRPDLQKIGVRSGYSLVLEDPGDGSTEPLLQYQASSTHNHRVTLEMSKAKLSKESWNYLSSKVHAPDGAGQITFAPDTSGQVSGAPCRAMFLIEFPPQKPPQKARSVRLFPPTPDEFTQADKMRVIHLEGSSALRVRVSANSDSNDDTRGPGCRQRLTIGSWEQKQMPPNLELAFIAEPDSRITATLSPDPKAEGAFHTGSDEVDSLIIQPLSPRRVSIGPYGMSQPDQVRERAREPFLSVKDLALKGDSFELELAGLVGIPIPEVLGAWKWFLLAGINVPLILWTANGLSPRFRRRVKPTPAASVEAKEPAGLRIFLSYSWEDKDRVMEIYQLLKSSGADPWIDREKIRGGAEWELSIKQQMRESQRVIIFLSSDSIRKAGFAWAEMRMAIHIAEEQPEGAEFVIPARLDECRLPDLLTRWNCIDLFRPEGRQKLLQSLGLGGADDAILAQGSGQ